MFNIVTIFRVLKGGKGDVITWEFCALVSCLGAVTMGSITAVLRVVGLLQAWWRGYDQEV